MATEEEPFSTFVRVALLIPALSATISAESLRLNLASLIFSPRLDRIRSICGNSTTAFLPITQIKICNNFDNVNKYLFYKISEIRCMKEKRLRKGDA